MEMSIALVVGLLLGGGLVAFAYSGRMGEVTAHHVGTGSPADMRLPALLSVWVCSPSHFVACCQFCGGRRFYSYDR